MEIAHLKNHVFAQQDLECLS